jgi:squalene-hopene/tetraprenyl-beta-curcumene cyclase
MTIDLPVAPATAADSPSAPDPSLLQRTAETVTNARAHLISLQSKDGWWQGKLQSNVTIEAEDLLLREFLSIRTATETEQTARWIRSQQREDGTWATYYGGPAELSTTIEAWVGLRLAGDDPQAEHMARAAEYVRGQGGVHSCRVFTRIWLALFGLWSWDELPSLPPELILLPKWFPLNVYDWGCWARQTIVPLTLVGTARPCRPVSFGIDELLTPGPHTPPRERLFSWSKAFLELDKVLHAYQRRPLRRLREFASRRAERWILERQEADGSWGGIQPPWVYSVLALHLRGYSMEHPAVVAGLNGLESFLIHEDTPEGPVRWVEACQSPVWDTALAQIALLDSGSAPDHEPVTRSADWMLSQEVLKYGDWAVRRPDLKPSGWAFEFANVNYPDVDDTAEVVLALSRSAAGRTSSGRAAVDRGLAWSAGMQSKDGGWAAFDADNTGKLPTYLPFCDFGEVIDPPSADVTAHIVEMLGAAGMADDERCRRGVQWLLDHQEADGSWFGRWGANHLYGLGAAVPALVEAGVPTSHSAIRRAVSWLEEHQNLDGGWGEDLRSYRDPTLVGIGATTPSQTAWALMALLGAGERTPTVDAGVRWLVENQRPDGNWDEPYFTGTGFPGDFYLAYHLYRLVFPLSALGRYLKQRAGHDPREGTAS